MPSLKMKTKSSVGSVKEKFGLHVCVKSSVISKNSCSHLRISKRAAELATCTENSQDGMEVCTSGVDCGGDTEQQEVLAEENSQCQESTNSCSSNLETIFSPVLEPIEDLSEADIDHDTGSSKGPNVLGFGANGCDDNRSSSDYQTCNVSDFFISDMIIASLPLDGKVDNAISESNPFPEPSMLFDVPDEYMILPFLEDTAKTNNTNELNSCEEATLDQNEGSLYLAINQIKSFNQEKECDVYSDPDQAEQFDPQLFLKNLPELSDVSSLKSTIPPKDSRRRKAVTLVLDLDETLVHSTLEHSDDADFTFNVFFNMKEHTVYVKKRPYLHAFLERVSEMFEVVIFTASQSIYASQLLDILDPDGTIISRRVYRESCIFSDGSYTKDLTVLGVDLAKVAIIDNSPQVFRLQVNNGIPILSWFDDPSDCALISLLPFLETLAEVEDVRPIIAKKFGLFHSCLWQNISREPAFMKSDGISSHLLSQNSKENKVHFRDSTKN